MNNALQGFAGFVMCMQFFPLSMRDLLSFASLSAVACALAWAFITQPQPQDDLRVLQQCMALHPERYCRLTHAPGTLAHKQR